jgi:hypothetical protein
MTTGELLNLLEGDARSYRLTALKSMARNGSRMYELTEKDIRKLASKSKRYQRLVDAVLADFINEIACVRGGDRGERVKHLK